MSNQMSAIDENQPAITALSNAFWAVLVCTAANLMCGWGVDWVSGMTGDSRIQTAPTWIGSLIVGAKVGWPAVAVAALCGLFGRNMTGLTPTLTAVYLLALVDNTAALIVGILLALKYQSKDALPK